MPLADEVAEHYWWHSIDLGQGVVTPGAKSLETHAREFAAIFDRIELKGASIVDIGAWNGAYSFEAERRGAGRVLATDSRVWDHARLRGRETFELARAALGSDVEGRFIDIMEITPELCGLFDVVLFLGVFYHLPDPIEGLARAAALAREVLVVETQLDLEHVSGPAMAHYPADELGGDASNWWGPNISLMFALLRGHGFARIEAVSVAGSRAIFHAWRSDRLRLGDPPAELRLSPTAWSRRRKLRAGWRLIREALGLRAGKPGQA